MMSAGAGGAGPQSATGSSAKIEKSAALTVGLLLADFGSGATMELGRSRRSMMSAGAGGAGPQSATGSSAKIEKSAALTVGLLLADFGSGRRWSSGDRGDR